MKRWLVFLVLTATVFLSGCAAQPTAQPPTTDGFSCRVTADYDDLAFAGDLRRETDENISLTLAEPATLEGLVLAWDGKALTATMHGISTTVDANKVPQAAVLPLVLDVLDNAAKMNDGEKTTDGWAFTGEWEGHTYTLVSDPQTGHLISISVPDVPLVVRFSDFQPLT